MSARTRTVLPAALVAAVVAAALSPSAVAAPPKPKPKPKPITASYAVQGAPVPLPLVGGVPSDDSCADPRLEGISTTSKSFTSSGAGSLVVEVTGFQGDWDITLLDKAGKVIGIGAGSSTGGTSVPSTAPKEKLVQKLKKGGTFKVSVCNFAGTPRAQVKYVFTYA